MIPKTNKLWMKASNSGIIYYVTAGDFKDDAMTGHTEINFIDQNTNSLKQLNHYFDAIAKVIKAKKDKKNRNEQLRIL